MAGSPLIQLQTSDNASPRFDAPVQTAARESSSDPMPPHALTKSPAPIDFIDADAGE